MRNKVIASMLSVAFLLGAAAGVDLGAKKRKALQSLVFSVAGCDQTIDTDTDFVGKKYEYSEALAAKYGGTDPDDGDSIYEVFKLLSGHNVFYDKNGVRTLGKVDLSAFRAEQCVILHEEKSIKEGTSKVLVAPQVD